MTVTVAAILSLDGLTSGAIYALIALALLIVFTVTRVILVPQGQFVTYAALTFRIALREAIEATRELHATAGVFNFSPNDHAGLDKRAAVVVRVDGGKWILEN
jgi:branched-chain amino acid transport system permease protein